MSIIADAAGILSAEDRWIQRTSISGNRRCMWGALRDAAKDCCTLEAAHEELMRASGKISRVIEEQYPERFTPGLPEDRIIQFNDHRDTVFPDVQAVLEKALAGN